MVMVLPLIAPAAAPLCTHTAGLILRGTAEPTRSPHVYSMPFWRCVSNRRAAIVAAVVSIPVPFAQLLGAGLISWPRPERTVPPCL